MLMADARTLDRFICFGYIKIIWKWIVGEKRRSKLADQHKNNNANNSEANVYF